jgi:3-isopropylmalate/(R)-2-methylmalate dehydratase large subunit
MGFTFVEKVIGNKVGHVVHANEYVITDVDIIMASDTTAPIAIKSFHEMGGVNLAKPESTVFILDHATPCPNEKIAELHQIIRQFAYMQKCIFFDQNHGVCHQVILENKLVREGDVVLGADSHTCSYGAVGAFSTGVGSTDLGATMLTGKTWLRVPETIRINLNGKLPKGVYAKDVILWIIGNLTSNGATYMALEYGGNGFAHFSLDEAITICNMTVEMGGKSGVFLPALKNNSFMPDDDAVYSKILNIDANEIEPVVACPHTVDNVKLISEVEHQKIDLVYIGSCTNGRLSDIAVAAEILRGKRIARGTRMIICPASSLVLKEIIKKGYFLDLIEAGATFSTPGCSLCVGTLGGVPGNGESVLSTTNRNFRGRMGNNKAQIYLGSPATAAATALCGCIMDPREVMS